MADNDGGTPPSSAPGNQGDRRFPPGQRHLRLSDAERDLIANELGEALSEGRLSAEEHAERLDTLFAAKTQGELEPLVADLPAPGGGVAPRSAPSGGPLAPGGGPSSVPDISGGRRIVAGRPTSLHAHTALSSTERSGPWVVPARYPVSSVMGAITIDLRQARFLAQETTIKADTYCGSVEVILPPDVIVRVDGTGIMGDYWLEGERPHIEDPHAPIVTVTGYAFMGSVWAVYRSGEPTAQKGRPWRRDRRGPGSAPMVKPPRGPRR